VKDFRGGGGLEGVDPSDRERAQIFATIFEANYGRVHAYATRRVGADAADDVTAETMMIAWRRRNALPAEPLPWLFGIARNLVARQHHSAARRRALRRSLEFERAEPGEEPAGDPALAAAWAALRPRDREVLALIAWEELSVHDAATVLGVSAPVFSVRLHRARRHFEALLGHGAPAAHPVPEPTEAS
jgi:RNA polymerase sigma-70 factor (ECF subfamily)